MIKVTFACGHVNDLSGNEQEPTCHCGETQIASVKARAPKFKGYALGPCATFTRLKPRKVELKGQARG